MGVVSQTALAGCICVLLHMDAELYTDVFLDLSRISQGFSGLAGLCWALPGLARPYQALPRSVWFSEGSGYSTLEGSSFRDYWLP